MKMGQNYWFCKVLDIKKGVEFRKLNKSVQIESPQKEFLGGTEKNQTHAIVKRTCDSFYVLLASNFFLSEGWRYINRVDTKKTAKNETSRNVSFDALSDRV